MLSTVIEEEGPFDGILGYSHGGTLAYSFLAEHARRFPLEPPFRCGIFFNASCPFRLVDGKIVDETTVRSTNLNMPTLHVVSESDFMYKQSLKLLSWCGSGQETLIRHEKGHAIPNDAKMAKAIGDAIRKLSLCAMTG
jgi:hypothetical protein